MGAARQLAEGIDGTLGSRWDVAWLLILALSTFGLTEGDPDALMNLHCYQMIPSNKMNCSWHTWQPPDVNATHILYYQSKKLHRDQTHAAKVPKEQNWLIIERENLVQGDTYQVWIEAQSAPGIAISNMLILHLDDIVKPPPPELEPVEVLSASEAVVKWEVPQWSEDLSHQPLTCGLQYKTSAAHNWTYLSEDDVSQAGHELERLEPFSSYEVQVRCIAKDDVSGTKKGFWSEWSLPQTFKTFEAVPVGQVDVWRKVVVSKNQASSLLLLWKPLDPKTARGNILRYTVTWWDHIDNTATMTCPCCNATLPQTAACARVSAHNSVGATLPVNLSLKEADLPGPQDILVHVASQGITVSWNRSPSPQWVHPEEYVVEWGEETTTSLSNDGELLNWTHIGHESNSAFLQGDFRPKVPYLICVYALYAQGSSTSVSVRAYFQEAAPSAGPQALQDRSISSTISLISWEEIPLAARNGHITHYTLYLKLPTSEIKTYSQIGATESSYKLLNLDPSISYQVWMTGSTSAGEGKESPLHNFRTSDSHWHLTLAFLLSGGFLLILAVIVMVAMYRWFFVVCHKILPLWCWEKIPDPGHSVVLKREEQCAASVMAALGQCPDQSSEEQDIMEIKESTPEQTAPPSSVSKFQISGYERHFMPTSEELQQLA